MGGRCGLEVCRWACRECRICFHTILIHSICGRSQTMALQIDSPLYLLLNQCTCTLTFFRTPSRSTLVCWVCLKRVLCNNPRQLVPRLLPTFLQHQHWAVKIRSKYVVGGFSKEGRDRGKACEARGAEACPRRA